MKHANCESGLSRDSLHSLQTSVHVPSLLSEGLVTKCWPLPTSAEKPWCVDLLTQLPFPHPHTRTHRAFEVPNVFELPPSSRYACQHCKYHGHPVGGHENNPPPQTRGHLHHAEPGLLVGSSEAFEHKFQLDITRVRDSLRDKLPHLSDGGSTGSSHYFLHNPEIQVPGIVVFPIDFERLKVHWRRVGRVGRQALRPHRHASRCNGSALPYHRLAVRSRVALLLHNETALDSRTGNVRQHPHVR